MAQLVINHNAKENDTIEEAFLPILTGKTLVIGEDLWDTFRYNKATLVFWSLFRRATHGHNAIFINAILAFYHKEPLIHLI